MPNEAKYGHLLKDGDLRRWHDNLAASSPITAEVYLRTLGLYCDLASTTPKQILKDGPTKRFRDGFTDFVRQMERKGKAGSYI
ncbi:MAG: site-specific integrase, partial [Nitrososphaerota archaeon]|nr:site-specific integrase [Nitrososphaerota archaeon]